MISNISTTMNYGGCESACWLRVKTEQLIYILPCSREDVFVALFDENYKINYY